MVPSAKRPRNDRLYISDFSFWEVFLSELLTAIIAYETLYSKKYVLEFKNKQYILRFTNKSMHHLLGLHKLKDINVRII